MRKKPLSERAKRRSTYTKKDGTVVHYESDPWVPKPAPVYGGGKTVGALIKAFEKSDQWKELNPESRWMYSHYLGYLRPTESYLVKQVKYADLRDVRNLIRDLGDVPGQPRGGKGAAYKFCTVVSAMFGWAMLEGGWGMIINPAAKLKRGLKLGEIPTWTEAQVRDALTLLPERLWRVAFIVAETSLRRSDVLALQWTQDEGVFLRVVQQKLVKKLGVEGATVLVPITSRLRKALDQWKQEARVHRVWERGPRDAKGNYIAKGKHGGARTKSPEGHVTSGAIKEVIRLGEPGTGYILVTDKGLPWVKSSFASQFNQTMTRIALLHPGMFPMKKNRSREDVCALTLHGIRKYMIATGAEAGGTTQELMAAGGWKSGAQVDRYARRADRNKLALALNAKIERARALKNGKRRNTDPELDALVASIRELLSEFPEPGMPPEIERQPIPNQRWTKYDPA